MIYEITVRGHVGRSSRAAFAEFDIALRDGNSVLCGEIVDQPALHGVLERLQRLGLVLLDVHALTKPEEGAEPG